MRLRSLKVLELWRGERGIDYEQIHVLRTHDGVRRVVHDDDGDLHDSIGERCLLDERNGDVICEACQGPDSEVECGETCPHWRPTVVEMGFSVSMCEHVVQDRVLCTITSRRTSSVGMAMARVPSCRTLWSGSRSVGRDGLGVLCEVA